MYREVEFFNVSKVRNIIRRKRRLEGLVELLEGPLNQSFLSNHMIVNVNIENILLSRL